MMRAPKADLIFEVDGATQGQAVEGQSGPSRRQGSRSALVQGLRADRWPCKADLNQQLAYTAAKVLECAVEALASEGARMRQETLKLYLNGCSAYAELAAVDPRPLVPVFREVVEQAPTFEGAWAKLIHAETELAI